MDRQRGAVGGRMRGHDDEVSEESLDRRGREAVEVTLDDVSVVPVLLALTALAPRPMEPGQLGGQAREDHCDRREKPPPVARRTAGMNRPAVGTAPALHPSLIRKTIEIAGYVAMAPETPSPTPRTLLRSGPGEELPLTHDLGHTGRHG